MRHLLRPFAALLLVAALRRGAELRRRAIPPRKTVRRGAPLDEGDDVAR
jgi:hypothetical protein